MNISRHATLEKSNLPVKAPFSNRHDENSVSAGIATGEVDRIEGHPLHRILQEWQTLSLDCWSHVLVYHVAFLESLG